MQNCVVRSDYLAARLEKRSKVPLAKKTAHHYGHRVNDQGATSIRAVDDKDWCRKFLQSRRKGCAEVKEMVLSHCPWLSRGEKM
jgi:hypothetical protein